jgi:hypothetical protein
MAAALLGGCDQRSAPSAPSAVEATPSAAAEATPTTASASAGINSELSGLRQATSAFHDIDQAAAAGWSTQLTPCLTLPGVGGMGFHYANAPLIDGAVSELQPEALLYEPRGNTLHFVGVEYIVPFDAWTSATPPTLFGETFHRNEPLGIWALHVWLWKPNPSGMFADWNPNVSCPAP